MGDDDDDVVKEGEDLDFEGPSMKRPKPSKFTLEMDDKGWIAGMCRWADKVELSDENFYEGLCDFVMVGKQKIEDITLSQSTVERIRRDERLHVGLSINLRKYDTHVMLHFDGKKVRMGARQGGKVIEHLPVIITGVSGEFQLGIEIAESSSGEKI